MARVRTNPMKNSAMAVRPQIAKIPVSQQMHWTKNNAAVQAKKQMKRI
jgi:hypothetical protein